MGSLSLAEKAEKIRTSANQAKCLGMFEKAAALEIVIDDAICLLMDISIAVESLAPEPVERNEPGT